MLIRRGVAAVALVTAALAISCTGDDIEDVEVSTDPTLPGGGRAEDPTAPGQGTNADRPIGSVVSFAPTEVASVLVALDQGEIAHGHVAQRRAAAEEVRDFARRMVDDHVGAAERMASIVPVADVERDPTARVFARHAELIRQELEHVPAADVDLVYMTTQVAAHGQALALLDRALIPTVAQNTRASSVVGANPPIGGLDPTSLRGLDAELRQRRATISQHLDEALRLQERFRIAAAAGASPSGGGGATTPR